MIKYYFRVNNDRLSLQNQESAYTGNTNTYECQFDFTGWDSFPGKVAVFNGYLSVIGSDSKAVIPVEALESADYLKIGVYGVNASIEETPTQDASAPVKRISTNVVNVRVDTGAYTEGITPEDPSSDVWDNIVAMVGGFSNQIQEIQNELSQKVDKVENMGLTSISYATGLNMKPHCVLETTNALSGEMVEEELYNKAQIDDMMALAGGDVNTSNLVDKSLYYYGDSNIVPTDEGYFTITEDGAVSRNLNVWDDYTVQDVVIPYEVNGIKVTKIAENGFGKPDDAYPLVLTTVIMPNSITSIGYTAFSYCPIENIVIPDGVTLIDGDAFFCCERLKSVTIPNSVKTIKLAAFQNTFLNNVIFKGSKSQWDAIDIAPTGNEALLNANIIFEGNLATEEYVDTMLDEKVDKSDGMGLSNIRNLAVLTNTTDGQNDTSILIEYQDGKTEDNRFYGKLQTDELLKAKVSIEDVVDDLITADSTRPLSANMGKFLDEIKLAGRVGYWSQIDEYFEDGIYELEYDGISIDPISHCRYLIVNSNTLSEYSSRMITQYLISDQGISYRTGTVELVGVDEVTYNYNDWEAYATTKYVDDAIANGGGSVKIMDTDEFIELWNNTSDFELFAGKATEAKTMAVYLGQINANSNHLNDLYERKADKTTISTSSDTAYVFDLSDNYNKEVRLTDELLSISFNIPTNLNDDYISSLSFSTGDVTIPIDYPSGGVINWVGTDCSISDGISNFIPSPNKHYDIVFYYNGTSMVGVVNGFIPATVNNTNEVSA